MKNPGLKNSAMGCPFRRLQGSLFFGEGAGEAEYCELNKPQTPRAKSQGFRCRVSGKRDVKAEAGTLKTETSFCNYVRSG